MKQDDNKNVAKAISSFGATPEEAEKAVRVMSRRRSGLMKHLTKLSSRIYVSLSDCDGMCDHCNVKLKEKCTSKNSGK